MKHVSYSLFMMNKFVASLPLPERTDCVSWPLTAYCTDRVGWALTADHWRVTVLFVVADHWRPTTDRGSWPLKADRTDRGSWPCCTCEWCRTAVCTLPGRGPLDIHPLRRRDSYVLLGLAGENRKWRIKTCGVLIYCVCLFQKLYHYILIGDSAKQIDFLSVAKQMFFFVNNSWLLTGRFDCTWSEHLAKIGRAELISKQKNFWIMLKNM